MAVIGLFYEEWSGCVETGLAMRRVVWLCVEWSGRVQSGLVVCRVVWLCVERSGCV